MTELKTCKGECGLELDFSMFRSKITTAGNISYRGTCKKCSNKKDNKRKRESGYNHTLDMRYKTSVKSGKNK